MREAGLTPLEVLAAATSEAGKELGLAPLGRLVADAPADVIAVRGDARGLRDDFAAPLLVVAGGRVIAEPGR
jgi:imidazolonepropionase-like amidohydrolase